MRPDSIFIAGCGGHGRVILDILKSCHGPDELQNKLFFLDDREHLWNTVVDGARVAGGLSLLDADSRVFLGVGDNITRGKLYAGLKARGCLFPRLIAPSAVISPTSQIDEGVVVFARAVVQTGARIGACAVINTAAIVEHDCRILPFVQLAPAVALSGNVTVGEGTLLGTGCSVNKNVSIGDYCLISPGLPVIKNVADHMVYKLDTSRILVENNRRFHEVSDGAAV